MELPESWELISFFESEPALLDPDQPWFYNRVTFRLERDGKVIEAGIEPSDRLFALEWKAPDGATRLRLDLNGVDRLAVEEDQGRAVLTASFPESSAFYDLRLQVRPHISVSWGIDLYSPVGH
jgi:hypothetical protein